MSALTKLFVILLVLMSLLLSAATVVFVNRVDDWRKAAEAFKQSAEQLSTSRDQWRIEAIAAKSRENEAVRKFNDAQDAARKAALDWATAKAGLDRQIADLTSARQRAEAQAKDAMSMAALAEQTKKLVETRVDGMLKTITDLQTANTKWISDNAELVRNNEIMARDLRTRDEQLAQLKLQVQQYGDMIDKAGLKVAEVSAKPVDVNLKGVVQGVQKDGGQVFATISLGTADRVERGMEFVVLSPNLEFLGKLIVDKVDQTASFGHLEGPRIADVRENCQVRTKL